MKKYLIPILSITIIASINACGSPEPEPKKKNLFGALKELSESMEELAENMEENLEENNGTFNTGEAIDHSVLQTFLPESISGYSRNEPTSSSVSMQGFNVSSAEVEFTSDNGTVKVIITDYLAAASMYQMASMMWTMGISIDSPEEKTKGYKFNDTMPGWLSFKKKRGNAVATSGVNGRIIVVVEATEQTDYENVKEILENMDLEKLSELNATEDTASN